MCASCQLPCSDANPPWLVPTGNWAQTGAKQTQEGTMAHGNPVSLLLFISLSLFLSHPYPLFPFSSRILQTNFCFASNTQLTFSHSCRFLSQPDDSAVTCESYKHPQRVQSGGWIQEQSWDLCLKKGRLCFTVYVQLLLDAPVTLPPVEILLLAPREARVEKAEDEFIQKMHFWISEHDKGKLSDLRGIVCLCRHCETLNGCTHTYTHLRAHSSTVLAEFELLDSFGMAKATHPSALCLSNVVTP